MHKITIRIGLALFLLVGPSYAQTPCNEQWLSNEEFAGLDPTEQSVELDRLARDLKNGCQTAQNGLGYLMVKLPEKDQLRWLSLLITVSELQARQLNVQSALVDQFLDKIKALTAAVDEANTKAFELSKVEGQLGALEAERDRLKGLIQVRDAELEKLQAERGALSDDRENFQSQLAKKTERLAQANTEIEELNQHKSNFESLYQEKKSELIDARDSIERLNIIIDEMRETIADRDEELNLANEKIENFIMRASRLEQLNASKDILLEDASNNFAELNQRFKLQGQELSSVLQDNLNLNNENTDFIKELEVVAEELNGVELQNLDLQKTVEELGDIIKGNEKLLEIRSREYNDLVDQGKELALLLAEMNAENRSLADANRLASTALEDLKKEIADSVSMSNQVVSENQQVIAENAALKRKRQILASELAAAKKDFLSKQAELVDAYAKSDRLQSERDAARSELEKSEAELRNAVFALNARTIELKKERDALEEATLSLNEALADLDATDSKLLGLEAELKDATADLGAAQAELSDLKDELAADQKAIRILRELRSEFYSELSKVIDGRDDIRAVGDRFVFQSEVLFSSGSAELSANGRSQIEMVAALLKELEQQIPEGLKWVLQVNGHTDSQPIKPGGRFEDNWQLSTARALSVVRVLQEKGVSAEHLSAAGYGEFQPVVSGKAAADLALNRRIELKLTD